MAKKRTLERNFQKRVIDRLKNEFAGCMVLKNDSSYLQGIPDLLVLYAAKWAMLEVKKSSTARHQPNQDYYVDKLNQMSYASFIYPENEEEVFNELHRAFQS